jgi:hypothetical protein
MLGHSDDSAHARQPAAWGLLPLSFLPRCPDGRRAAGVLRRRAITRRRARRLTLPTLIEASDMAAEAALDEDAGEVKPPRFSHLSARH